ncbi:MAG TPA: TetR/AcrR family transcriptional regulator [Puia sp.]|nr:TetR/AcrR family transcriptional regulator [Puia sp.]
MKQPLNPAPQKEDRRTQKTKKFLADALKELIQEKGYDNVTIQDIIDRANVGRSTFYAHYENKEQLMVGNINFQQSLVDPPPGEVYPMGINLSYLFHHTKEHLFLVKGIAGTQGMTALYNYFTELCAGKILDYHKGKLPRSKMEQKLFRYRAEAAAGGIVRMLFKWLEDGAVVPAEEMVASAERVLGVVVSL